MKIFFLILIPIFVLFVCGCNSEPRYRSVEKEQIICDDSTIEKRAEFILTCLKNANPKSDEEPEDWILKCQKMAEDTYCKRKIMLTRQVKYPGGYWKDMRDFEAN